MEFQRGRVLRGGVVKRYLFNFSLIKPLPFPI